MTQSTLPHTFTITTGDPSRDGHNQCDTTAFLSNRTLQQIKVSYAAAARQYGIDITKQCEEYEDSSVSKKYWKAARVAFANVSEALQIIGITDDPNQEYDADNQDMYTSSFVELWFQTAKLVDPELVWEEAPMSNDHYIGGYGLYY